MKSPHRDGFIVKRGWLWLTFDFILAHFAVQMGSLNAELLCRFGDVPVVPLETVEDKTALKFLPGHP